jgi:hypothetical protein
MMTVARLLVLTAGVQAESGSVVVRIQHDFVAGGKALPAGTYKISRSSSGAGQVLILRGNEPGTSMFLVPSAHDDSVPDQRQVKLKRVGDLFYLSEVATDLGVFTLATPRTVADTIKAKNRERNHSAVTP